LSRETASAKDGERIAKALARAGIASRRDCERLIEAGRVTLNGVCVATPATFVNRNDALAVDGRPVAGTAETRLWRYHKPVGLVTTARDPEGRPTVFDAMPEGLPRLVSVGRLDINTEGLLLLTNDGGLARYLEHPEQGFPRTYRVRAHGRTDVNALARLGRGVIVGGVQYRPMQVALDSVQGGNCWLTLTVTEGKNREIKNLLAFIGLHVTRLIRVGYGPFHLGKLRRGAVEESPARLLPVLLPDYFR
jgi:23S rRNA pseudouridine2605 synthase